eukprot:7238912-Lingulodinium_polyedra.AAC.1
MRSPAGATPAAPRSATSASCTRSMDSLMHNGPHNAHCAWTTPSGHMLCLPPAGMSGRDL